MFVHSHYPASHSIQSFLVPLPCYFLSDACLNSLPASPHSLTSLDLPGSLLSIFISHIFPAISLQHPLLTTAMVASCLAVFPALASLLFRDGRGEGNQENGERGRGEKRTRNKFVGCQSAIHVQSLPSPTQNPAQNNFFLFGKRKASLNDDK